MSEQTIRGALQAQLLTLGWATQTAYEGKTFLPTPGTPYQEVTTVFAEPIAYGIGATASMLTGIFQVRLLYPVKTVAEAGIGVPWARAELIAAAFTKNLRLPSPTAMVVKIMRRPQITRGPVQGDRDVTIVRIRFGDR